MHDYVEEIARNRARYVTGMIWHLGAFVILNGFFWLLDVMVGQSGLQWAYWITLFWGLGLAFHVLAFFVDGRQVEERLTQKYAREYRAAMTRSGGLDS